MIIRTHKIGETNREAGFSVDNVYRYYLSIIWNVHKPLLIFVMLNPSKASELVNDPTVERCERRARRDGYGGVMVLNIFAFRATDPKDMKAAIDPVGPLNNVTILKAFEGARLFGHTVIAAWGSHGSYRNRAREIALLAHNSGVRLYALGFTGTGQPRHPLYLKSDAQPLPYSPHIVKPKPKRLINA